MASPRWFTPSHASQEKVKFASACRTPATRSARRERHGAGEQAARDAAEQRGDQAHAFDDRRIARFVEADVEHERTGHDAGEGVGQLVQHDEEQDQQRVALGEEIGEGGIGCAEEPRNRGLPARSPGASAPPRAPSRAAPWRAAPPPCRSRPAPPWRHSHKSRPGSDRRRCARNRRRARPRRPSTPACRCDRRRRNRPCPPPGSRSADIRRGKHR